MFIPKKIFSRLWAVALIGSILCWGSSAIASDGVGPDGLIDGQLLPRSSTLKYEISIGALSFDSSGYAMTEVNGSALGSTLVFYSCDSVGTHNHSYSQEKFFTASFPYVSSDINPGYFKLNEYLDIRVSSWMAGTVNAYIPLPWANESNLADNYTLCREQFEYYLEGGGKIKAEFKIRKPIINGVLVPGGHITDMYAIVPDVEGKYPYPSYPSIPVVSIDFLPGYIVTTQTCTVNGGGVTSVDFGDIPNTSSIVNNGNYNRQVNLQVFCSGFSPPPELIMTIGSMQMQGMSNLFPTDVSNLYISLLDDSMMPIELNKGFAFPLQGMSGSIKINLSPKIIGASSIAEGPFRSFALLFVSYP